VNPEQDAPTLAAQAAAWVPPWRRATDESPPDATERPADEAAAEPAAPGEAAGRPETLAPVTPPGETAGRPETLAPVTPPGWTEMVGVPTHRPEFTPRDDALAGEDLTPVIDLGRRVPAVEPVGTPEDIRAVLEAVMLVADQPVAESQLADVLGVPVTDVAAHLTGLAAEYTAQGRGFELRRAAGGWRLYTRPEHAPYVERFVLDGQSVRLTQAALETLAVIAYQQPVTRSRISAIRGVNCDGVVRTLVTRGLIEECGTQPESGAFLYRTTALFLEKLGLDSIDELPPLAPFLPDDVEGLADVQR
jgi:segregation and condensation protein B